MSREARFLAVRAKVASLEAGAASRRGTLPFGDARVDGRLPGGGLPLGRWHEAVGEALEAETGAVTGAFIATLAAPLAARGVVIWVMRRDDLYAPGLCNLGFPVARLIQVKARDEAEALGALEDALASSGVAAAIGEVAGVDLTQGRRLQLACEKHGAAGFVIRRQPFGRPARPSRPGFPLAPAPDAGAGSAAATRWRIGPAPSEPALGEPGLGAPRWHVTLERCRGGRPGAWIMEKSDGPHPLRVVAELGDRQLETPPPFRLAG